MTAVEEPRKFHNDPESVYNLPNDNAEHIRLDTQAKHISSLMGHHILHSPIPASQLHRLLDIGCGTGYVTDILARQFPHASVFGLDFSPVPPSAGGRPHAENTHFLRGNFLTQEASSWTAWTAKDDRSNNDIPNVAGKFDLIFSRYLISALKPHEWPIFIAREANLLRSGGWLEVQEFDPILYDGADQPINADAEYVVRASKRSLIDHGAAWNVAGHMRTAGFEDVTTKWFPLPVGGMGQETAELREAGDWFAALFVPLWRYRIVDDIPASAEEHERLMEMVKRDFEPGDGKHCKIVVTYGRKP